MENLMDYEEFNKLQRLVVDLKMEIDYKNQIISEMKDKHNCTCEGVGRTIASLTMALKVNESMLSRMEDRYNEAAATVKKLLVEKKRLQDDLIEARRKMNFIRHQNARVMSYCECKKELKQQAEKELKLYAAIELETNKFLAVQDKFQKALEDLKDAYALASELEDEVEDLKSHNEVLILGENMRKLEEEVEDLKSHNGVLILRENMSNRELQDAHKAAIMGLRGIVSDRTSVGIKRMGEIDVKQLVDICKQKYAASEDREVQCATLCSYWENTIKDPHWHPFKNIEIQGRLQEVIDDEDEKLRKLREELGNEVYEAVVRALLELNEFNPSGRYPVPELWNFREQRKASVKEIMEYTIKKCKKRKRY